MLWSPLPARGWIREAELMSDERFEMVVAEVWNVPEHDSPVVAGPVRRGRPEPGQHTELVDGEFVLPVPHTQVQVHPRTGEISFALRGLDRDAVRAGLTLRARTRWTCYSTVRFKTGRHGVPAGTLGTIVDVYGTAYEVEVADASGRTEFLAAVEDDELELVEDQRG